MECARSRETVKRLALAGWAEYGHCTCHSRCVWGPRLHLVCTVHRLPIAHALTVAKADERSVPTDLIQSTPALAGGGRTIIAECDEGAVHRPLAWFPQVGYGPNTTRGAFVAGGGGN